MTDLQKLMVLVADEVHEWDGPNAGIDGNPECWKFLSNERKAEEVEKLIKKWSFNIAEDKRIEKELGL